MDLRVAISERKAAAHLMGHAGEINPLGGIHTEGKARIIQAKRVLVHKHKQLARSWSNHFRGFPVSPPWLIRAVTVRVV